jgi:hypothetical protein
MGFQANDDREFDAPALWLFAEKATWVVKLHEYTPGPGPGDFHHTYDELPEAIEDVLDYYFGNPDRMQEKWRAAGLG